MQRTLVIVGLALLAIGLLWPWLGKLPLGRLPGDFVVERGGFRLYFPLATMALASLAVSLILWLLRR